MRENGISVSKNSTCGQKASEHMYMGRTALKRLGTVYDMCMYVTYMYMYVCTHPCRITL